MHDHKSLPVFLATFWRRPPAQPARIFVVCKMSSRLLQVNKCIPHYRMLRWKRFLVYWPPQTSRCTDRKVVRRICSNGMMTAKLKTGQPMVIDEGKEAAVTRQWMVFVWKRRTSECVVLCLCLFRSVSVIRYISIKYWALTWFSP